MEHLIDLHEVESYAKSTSRNKIVLSDSLYAGLWYIDVGYELASLLSRDSDSCNGKETACRKLLSKVQCDENIGSYLALKNIGILFEPELHLNLETIFEVYSKDQTLFICAEGSVRNDVFYFCDDENHSVDLKGLSYKRL